MGVNSERVLLASYKQLASHCGKQETGLEDPLLSTKHLSVDHSQQTPSQTPIPPSIKREERGMQSQA